MDQLAPAIAWIKKNAFWIASIVLSLALIGGWYSASTNIETEREKQVRKLKQNFSDMDNVSRVSAVTEEDSTGEFQRAHPNAVTEEKMTEQLRQTIDAIAEVWQQKYDQQRKLFIFPEDVLGENTFKFFNQGKVAEDFANGTVVSTKEKTYLRTYREQIPKQVAKIARHVRAYWKYDAQLMKEKMQKEAEFKAMGDRGMGANQTDVVDTTRNKYAVIWKDDNQNLWKRKMIEFRDWDDNGGSTQDPTILQAYILQQDIWLLEAMFNVIREVNGEAITNDLAVIKEIDYVGFGTEARAKLGELSPIDVRLGGGAASSATNQGFLDDQSFDYSGDSPSGPTPSGIDNFNINGDPSPFHGRYVNAKQEPLSAEAVRNTINGDVFPEKDLELIVTKRVPFRLAVKMDERKINEFLAECANAPLPFEVEQLRINKHDPDTVLEFKGGIDQRKEDLNLSLDDSMGGDRGMSSLDDSMSFGVPSKDLETLKSTPVETRLDYDVRVEFYGIVRIFNPVRKDFLLKAVELPPETPDDSNAPAADGVAVLDRKIGN